MPTYVYKYLRLIYCRLHLLIGIDVLILILTAILIKNHPTHVHTLSIKSWTRELGTKTAQLVWNEARLPYKRYRSQDRFPSGLNFILNRLCSFSERPAFFYTPSFFNSGKTSDVKVPSIKTFEVLPKFLASLIWNHLTLLHIHAS